MLKSLNEVKSLFNTDNKEYVIKDKTHLINVVNSIEKFNGLKTIIINNYSNLKDNSVNREIVKIKKVKDRDFLRILMCAELLKKDSLKKDIEFYIQSDDLTYEMQNNIKSKDDGLDYAVAIGILDDYINYLEGYNYSGPKTSI